jgi:tetratricopeptide (TPR) repeat protein
MDPRELLARYEAHADEATYLEAKRRYEEALAANPADPRLAFEYGYLIECHGRNELLAAARAYERAIDLAPAWEKPRYQLISVRAARFDSDEAVATYRRRLAESPNDVNEYRYLAYAYLFAHQPKRAEETIRAGLALAPHDATLTYQLGEVLARTERTDEALAAWKRALELNPESIEAHYTAAFLLEREGRLAEAADEWRAIIEWNTKRQFMLETEWPKRELARVTAKLKEP